ncbi:T9SS type A sorting domain-containing protein [Salibacter halophilus]|uniref:T9SS type A sorting domain-containing protein n=1 Tax=Salibacter halophilus TaxID=1803916 RepID=A0A6N6MC41_9FLAO|nr:DNRLRE domain-containing protein [Salibacter halophilus]KAB1066103.1 T9SS type A sorting domain-containing protein [Salibacter halophilus]
MKKIYSVLASVAISITAFAQSHTIDVYPLNDASVYAGQPDNANGQANLVSGTDDNGQATYSLLHFDLVEIPANASITSAELVIEADNPEIASVTYLLHVVENIWSEGSANPTDITIGASASSGDVTYNNAVHPNDSWPNGSNIEAGYSFSPIDNQGDNLSASKTTLSFNSSQFVTLVQSWVDSPSTNYGVLLKEATPANGNLREFFSYESSNTLFRPTLSITYTGDEPIDTTTTSIREDLVESKLSVYPNPTTSNIRITDIPEDVNQLTIMNISGQVVKVVNSTELNSNVVMLDVSDLTKGTYFIKGSENTIAHKFVVM